MQNKSKWLECVADPDIGSLVLTPQLLAPQREKEGSTRSGIAASKHFAQGFSIQLSWKCAVRIVSASGNPSDVHVVLQNAGAIHGPLLSAVLQDDVAAWCSSVLTVEEGHGQEPSLVSVVYRSARGGVYGSQAKSVRVSGYEPRVHPGSHHHCTCAVCTHPRGKEVEAPPPCIGRQSKVKPDWSCSLIMIS